MRIIDKNQDFYDYLQDSTDTLVFDRRQSFLLTREMLYDKLKYTNRFRYGDYTFVLLQCDNNFWLFLVNIMDSDYTIELLKCWKNYNKERKKISLYEIRIASLFFYYLHDIDDIRNNIDKFVEAIDRNDFEYTSNLGTNSKHTDYKNGWKEEIQNIPLLKACGIANLIDPLEIFCAIEEYFSLEKTASETTEPKGVTNDDKIIMHGFDTKTSFRGKR